MFKKLFSIFAALTLCVGLFAKTSVITYTATAKLSETTASAAVGLHLNAFYAADSTQLTVTHTFDQAESVGTITLDGELAIIGDRAFYSTSIASITIPEGVTTIGERAFYQCKSLASVTLPASLTTIGVRAFERCSTLTPVTLSEGLTTIGEKAFQSCSALQSITLPAGLTTIGGSAFYDCSKLTSITLPASVTSIGENAFALCAALASVTFLGNACQEGIGNNAFYNVGNPDPALLTLPNSWTGTLPNAQGKWYGGYFEMSEIPTALPTLPYEGKVGKGSSKFFRNGQLIIRKENKAYSVGGARLK